MNFIEAMFANKNTTFMGIATILVAVGTAAKDLFDGNPDTVMNVEATIAAITAGIGLIMAGDGKKD